MRVVIFTLLGLSAVFSLAEERPVMSFVRDFVVKESLFDGRAGRIQTVQDQMRVDSDTVFRRPPDYKKEGTQWLGADLVYVMPGGLEPDSSYTFPLDSELGDRYKNGTFSFSGRSDSLVYIFPIGWGTENTNGDFQPYLVSSMYEDIKEPAYEFMMSKQMGSGDTIYLNYMFKIPKQSTIKWGSELSFTRYTMAGTFSTNAPKAGQDGMVLWSGGRFTVCSGSLMRPRTSLAWSLPAGLKLESIALSSNMETLFTASADGVISAFSDNGSSQLWRCGGRGPLIVYKKWLICLSPDFRALRALDPASGKTAAEFGLPRYLPKSDNSIALASFDKADCLFYQVPAQSRILCYKLRTETAAPAPGAPKN
jgi:hypothetical protein